MAKKLTVDVRVIGDRAAGPMTSVYLLEPQTEAGRNWLNENLSEDARWLGGAVAVEHRYVGAIVEGLQAEGLVVR